MISEIHAMKLLHALSAANVLLALAGCRNRNPVGGCPYDEVEVSPQDVTPWDTVLEEDMAALVGPYPGTFTWLDGDDVITVPKAGQEIEVEAQVEVDLSTARMHEYIRAPDSKSACESDRLFVDAEVSFARLDDGKVELAVPVTIYRDLVLQQYYAESETPVEDFAPDLVPMEEHEVEAVFARMRWAYDTGNLHAELEYRGQTNDSPTTGHGSFKKVALFTPEE
jgi:hypothetical protein